MDNPDLDKKRIEVNTHLKEMYKEKNIFLIDHCKITKATYLNSSKIHLNRRGANILSNNFIQHISKVFKCQLAGNSSDCTFFTLDFEKYGLGQSEMNCHKTLKLFRKDNLNKIILPHLDINSIRNKFDCLSE